MTGAEWVSEANARPQLEAHPDEAGAGACDIAALYSYLGENDRGFEWLEKSYSRREGSILGIKLEDLFDGIPTARL